MRLSGYFNGLLKGMALLCFLGLSACSDQNDDAGAVAKHPVAAENTDHSKKIPDNDLVQKHFSKNEKGLHGKVRLVTTYCYNLLQGTTDGSRVMYQYRVDSFDEAGLNLSSSINNITNKHITGQTTIRYFNKQGNIIELNHYKYEGVDKNNRGPKFREQQYLYTYDDKGEVTGYRSLDSGARLLTMDYYRYDPEGRVIEVIDTVANSYNNRFTFEYKNNGTERWETDYGPGGTLMSKTTIKYNPNFTVSEQMVDGPNEGLQTRTLYKYSPEGYKSEEKIYGPNLKVKEIRNYEYDKYGNLTNLTVHGHDGKIDATQSYGMNYEYDNDLNITKVTTYKIINGVKKETKVDEVDIAYY